MIGIEIARGDRLRGGLDDAHANLHAADDEIVGPLFTRRAGIGELRQHSERREIKGRPLRRHLLEALMVDVVQEADGSRGLRDARRLVVGAIRNAAPEARGLVAVRVMGEGGGDRAATDLGDRVRPRRTARHRPDIARRVG